MSARLKCTLMRRTIYFLLIIVLLGCTTAPSTGETPIPETPLNPTATAVPIQETVEPEDEGPIRLVVWVPPQFDPAEESLAGALFQSQVNEFASRRANIYIEVRIKDVYGPGGILDTLNTASAAAPRTLPDLVALPRQGLEIATQNGVVHPYEGLTAILDEPDWYNFARQLSHLQNSTFGIPFAGDAILMTYRPEVIVEPPVDWETSLTITSTLTFPAADPEALVTLLHYQSQGGTFLGEDEQLVIDEVLLTNVLTYYQQANAQELMPFWLAQLENDGQSWDAYDQKEADLAITWVSRYFDLLPEDSVATSVPTFDGEPFTLADGWVWALTANDSDRLIVSAQLAEFLTTSEYLAGWTEAMGLIPPRPSSLTAWKSEPQKALLEQIVPSAQLIPAYEVITTLGPVLQQAAVSVIKAEADVNTAVQIAAEELQNP